MAKTKIVVIGAGGHGKVILDILLKQMTDDKKEIEIIGLLDDDDTKHELWGIPVLGKICEIEHIAKSDRTIKLINAIGNNRIRKEVVEKYDYLDIKYYTAIHPKAVIGNDVVIGDGTVVMANCVINSGTRIGKHVIINTSAIIEHDNKIEDYAHISPGVSCSGSVVIKNGTHIGTGTSVIPNITIGENSIAGAGSVVTKDIPDYCLVVGVPARPIKFFERGNERES